MKRLLLILILGCCSAIYASAGAPTVRYTLGMPQPWTHMFEVEIAFHGLPSAEPSLELTLPVWRTGRYVVFDFAGGVEEFSAVDGKDHVLGWEKKDKTTWVIKPGGAGTIIVRYKVYADEFSMRTRGLDDEHGFVDGTSVFMYATRYRNLPLTLTVVPFGTWHVTTGLDSVAGEKFHYRAKGYDELADCPLEIGNQRDHAFQVEGKPHVMSIFGDTNLQIDSLLNLTSRIISMNSKFWGGLPYDRYVFIVHASGDGGGGTEHLNSCVLDIAASFSRRPDPGRSIVGLISHEFLHTWNVKRLRPKGMDPYDWSRENYYNELWLAEGGTSYLHGLLLMRNGFSTVQGYIDGLHWQVEGDRQRPGNLEQSLTSCSFDAWIKYFRGVPQSFNFGTDLYGKGAQVCMLLDLEMRARTENRSSFDDLMRMLYRRFPLGSGGYTVKDVETVAAELAGESMHEFFAKFVWGTVPLEWEKALSYAGLILAPSDTLSRPWLGVQASDEGSRVILRRIIAGSPAYNAGLNSGDELVALNGMRIRGADLPRRVEEMNIGEHITLTIFRQDKLREVSLELARQPVPSYVVTRSAAPTAIQRRIYESWLGARWGS